MSAAFMRQFICRSKLVISLILVLLLAGCDSGDKGLVVEQPVATRSYIEPSNKYPKGAKKIEYHHGVFVIPEDLSSYSSVKPHRMFLELNVAWPDFEDEAYYRESERIDRVRILFEIDRKPTGTSFQNTYPYFLKALDEGLYDLEQKDIRYKGVVGYKKKDKNYFSLYEVVDKNLEIPMGTPLTIGCTRDDQIGHDAVTQKGYCRFNLVMDADLRIQVRFNKPLLKHSPELYMNTMELIYSIWSVK